MFDETGAMKDTWKGTDNWYENKLTDANSKIKTLEDAAANTADTVDTSATVDTSNTANTNNPSTTSDNSFDQFLKFMTALSGIDGLFGSSRYSYPNMGYGGGAPGGVAAANPYQNMMGFMNAFKSLNSSGSGSGSSLSTSSLNQK